MGEPERIFNKYEFVSPEKAVFFNDFISGCFAKDLLSDYGKYVDSEYGDNVLLKSPLLKSNYLTNFNLYSSVAFERYLNFNGLRGPRLEDIPSLKRNQNFNAATINLGVVFRGIGYPKERQAEAIAKELMKKGYMVNPQFSDFNPIVMGLSDLDIVFDKSYSDGLRVGLRNSANPICSESFSRKNNGKYFFDMNYDGPVLKKGRCNGVNMCLETADSGLAKLVFKNGSKLSSSDGAYSNSFLDSRVAIVGKI